MFVLQPFYYCSNRLRSEKGDGDFDDYKMAILSIYLDDYDHDDADNHMKFNNLRQELFSWPHAPTIQFLLTPKPKCNNMLILLTVATTV